MFIEKTELVNILENVSLYLTLDVEEDNIEINVGQIDLPENLTKPEMLDKAKQFLNVLKKTVIDYLDNSIHNKIFTKYKEIKEMTPPDQTFNFKELRDILFKNYLEDCPILADKILSQIDQ